MLTLRSEARTYLRACLPGSLCVAAISHTPDVGTRGICIWQRAEEQPPPRGRFELNPGRTKRIIAKMFQLRHLANTICNVHTSRIKLTFLPSRRIVSSLSIFCLSDKRVILIVRYYGAQIFARAYSKFAMQIAMREKLHNFDFQTETCSKQNAFSDHVLLWNYACAIYALAFQY